MLIIAFHHNVKLSGERLVYTRHGVILWGVSPLYVNPVSGDPVTRWCGGWGLNTLGYPIVLFCFFVFLLLIAPCVSLSA
jgi:hypothetical protein